MRRRNCRTGRKRLQPAGVFCPGPEKDRFFDHRLLPERGYSGRPPGRAVAGPGEIRLKSGNGLSNCRRSDGSGRQPGVAGETLPAGPDQRNSHPAGNSFFEQLCGRFGLEGKVEPGRIVRRRGPGTGQPFNFCRLFALCPGGNFMENQAGRGVPGALAGRPGAGGFKEDCPADFNSPGELKSPRPGGGDCRNGRAFRPGDRRPGGDRRLPAGNFGRVPSGRKGTGPAGP